MCFVGPGVLLRALKGEQFCKGFFAAACYTGGRARVTSAAAVKVVGMLRGVSLRVGVNSSPASRLHSSLTILNQQSLSFPHTSTGAELQGGGAACI